MLAKVRKGDASDSAFGEYQIADPNVPSLSRVGLHFHIDNVFKLVDAVEIAFQREIQLCRDELTVDLFCQNKPRMSPRKSNMQNISQ